jgi:hypothetical protein
MREPWIYQGSRKNIALLDATCTPSTEKQAAIMVRGN